MVQPDNMTDDLGGKAMAVVRVRWWLHTALLPLCDLAARPGYRDNAFMAHLHRWALAFLGSGLGGSYANCRRQRGVVSLSHAIASLEAGKSAFLKTRVVSGQPRGHRAGSPRVQRIPANQKPSTRVGRPCKLPICRIDFGNA